MMHPFNNYEQNTFNKTVAMVIEESYIKTKPNSFQILQKLIFLFPNRGYVGSSKSHGSQHSGSRLYFLYM